MLWTVFLYTGGDTMQEKQFYTVDEFAAITNYSARTIREKCRKGLIKAKKISGSKLWLIPVEELERIKN